MADDAPDKDQKIYDPSPTRLRKAREEGNLFRSKEVLSVGMLAIGTGLLFLGGPAATTRLEALWADAFLHAGTTPLTGKSTQMVLTTLSLRLLVILAPFFGVLLVAGIALNVAQSGWNVSMKVLEPKPDRISPLAGLKRIFSARGAFEVVKAVVKLAAVGPIVYVFIKNRLPELVHLHTVPVTEAVALGAAFLGALLFQLLLALGLLAGIDYAFERYRYREDLKMTLKEVRDEAKEQDGDPQIKGRRRAIARARLLKPTLQQAVQKADVVITNPTHYAVALRYDATEAPAPQVLVKGIRKRAQRIKAIAAEHHIPMIEDRPLARALYASVEEGQMIPEELFAAVAAILAELYRQREGRS